MDSLGTHIILELYGCPEDLLSQPDAIQKIMELAAVEMGATIVESRFHHFSPLGVSGVVIIQESHLTIHTWPEYEYAAIDLFTCGDILMEKGTAFLTTQLQATQKEVKTLNRGKGDFLKKISKT